MKIVMKILAKFYKKHGNFTKLCYNYRQVIRQNYKVRGHIMSQEKVDQYKESKKNRKQEVKKEKRKALLAKLGGGIVLLALVIWIGYSAVMTVQNAEGPSVTVDPTAIEEYVDSIE